MSTDLRPPLGEEGPDTIVSGRSSLHRATGFPLVALPVPAPPRPLTEGERDLLLLLMAGVVDCADEQGIPADESTVLAVLVYLTLREVIRRTPRR
ncbi:MAG TPA: hypothetical protein VN213_21415 [Solirubrobacteraceae bacterium]|nr:hypothetical protein [Solirubrobacteraceae bacterium]